MNAFKENVQIKNKKVYYKPHEKYLKLMIALFLE